MKRLNQKKNQAVQKNMLLIKAGLLWVRASALCFAALTLLTHAAFAHPGTVAQHRGLAVLLSDHGLLLVLASAALGLFGWVLPRSVRMMKNHRR